MPTDSSVESRAESTGGTSSQAIYQLVADEIRRRSMPSGALYDIGCGTGALYPYVQSMIATYFGADVVRYSGFPTDRTFIPTPLDQTPWPIESGASDVTVAIETIEHLENPRATMRELVRITRPNGLVIVTTPNQLSWLSKLCFLLKNQFVAFQERPGLYPAHLTALLEIDLYRIAAECGLHDVIIRYTDSGRIPGTNLRWPSFLTGRRFSDNILLSAVRR